MKLGASTIGVLTALSIVVLYSVLTFQSDFETISIYNESISVVKLPLTPKVFHDGATKEEAPWTIHYSLDTDATGVAKFLTDSWNVRNPSSRAFDALEQLKIEWRQIIYKNQHPEKCNTRPLCRCSNRAGGFFSKIHAISHCLIKAVSLNCTMVGFRGFTFKAYTHPQHCQHNREWCYFEKISRCNPNALTTVTTFIASQTCEGWANDLKEVRILYPSMNQLKSSLIVRSELLAFAFRANKATKQSIRSWARLLHTATAEEQKNFIGAHVRNGDKKTFMGFTDPELPTNYGPTLSRVANIVGTSNLHYMTDDVAFGNRINSVLGVNNTTLSQLHTVPFTVFPSYELHMKDPTARVANDLDSETIHSFDEGMLLFVEVFLLAHTVTLFGLQNSNVAQTATELHALTQYPAVFGDVFQQVYRPCWAGERLRNWRAIRTETLESKTTFNQKIVSPTPKMFKKVYEQSKYSEGL